MPVRVGPTSLVSLCLLTGVLQKWSDGLAVDLKTVPRNSALESFFGSIDKDGDGQIEPSEARQYIDANFDRSDFLLDASKAAQQMSKNLDGSDSDATISKDEIEGHLRRLLKGTKVVDWLKHAAQLPQYVQAFRQNSITSLDFPTLVADGGEILRTDLGVASKLHREQLVRALKRVMLGIGSPPAAPLDLQAIPLRCDAVALRWQPPTNLGQPPLHKYHLERQRLAGPQGAVAAPAWETANGDIDDEDRAYVDEGIQAGVYRYRLTAWNAMGWSDHAVAQDCSTADDNLSCPPGRCWRKGTCEERASLPGGKEGGTMWRLAMLWQLPLPLVVAGALLLAGVPLLGYMRHHSSEASKIVAREPKRAASGGPVTDGHALVGVLGDRSSSEGKAEAAGNSIAPIKVRRSVSEGRGLQAERVASLEERPLGGSRGVSPTRKPPARGDIFHPGDLEGFRGLSSHDLGHDPGLRQPSKLRGSQPGLEEAQNVVWLNDEGQQVNGPPALDIPASPQSPSSPGRHGCAFLGCEKALHPLFNPKSALTSHYCSICQCVFCHRHTRYSPHGKLGSCGMESKCICSPCFDELPRVTQERLEKSNKLQQKSKKDGMGVAGAQPSGGSGSNRDSPDKRRGASIFGNVFGSSNSIASSHDTPPGREREDASSRSSLGRSGAEQWARLRTAWKAAMQFQGAGEEHSRRRASVSKSPPLPPTARSDRKTQ